MGQIVWSAIAVVASLMVIAGITYALIEGREDRLRDEEAREYFSRHGRWPD